MLRQEATRLVVQPSPVCAEVADLNGSDMAQERRAGDARDGRQRANRRSLDFPSVAFNPRVDRRHTSDRCGPRSADGENLGESSKSSMPKTDSIACE